MAKNNAMGGNSNMYRMGNVMNNGMNNGGIMIMSNFPQPNQNLNQNQNKNQFAQNMVNCNRMMMNGGGMDQ